MTARDFLIRGLLAGLVAGLFTFVVANLVGEPSVDAAIAVEEDAVEEAVAGHADEVAADEAQAHVDAAGTEVSRQTQRTWGLATATLLFGPALGGIVALVAAGAVGRLGRLTPPQSTGLIALLGYVSVALVPFLKYPATPPAVGDPDTISARTGSYVAFLLVSVAAAVGAVLLARWLMTRWPVLESVVVATAAYLLVVVVVGRLMPTVDEIGAFPGDILWDFRRASLVTVTTLWAVLGVVLTALVGRRYERGRVRPAQPELAGSR